MGFFSSLLGNDAANANMRASRVYAKQAKKGMQKGNEQLKPYQESGLGSTNLLSDALGVNGPEAQAKYYSNFQLDPGFLASQQAGVNAIEQGATGAGGFRSGSTQKSLFDYGQRNLLSLFQDRLTRLGSLSGQGFSAAGKISDNLTSGHTAIGGALSSGIIGAANARTQGAQNALNAGVDIASALASAATGMPNMGGSRTGSASAGYLTPGQGPGMTYNPVNDLWKG